MITHFGLDIGTDSIKAVQVSADKQGVRLVAAGMVKSPPNVLSSDLENDSLALAEAIKKLKKEAGITTGEVTIAVPERHVFTHIFEFPKMSNEELEQAIPWEAENLIPKPLSEVNLDWQVLEDESKTDGKIRVFLVASPKELVNRYLKVLKMSDLIPVSLETELLSIMRCVQLTVQKKNFIIGNMGLFSCDIAVVKNNNIFQTRSLPPAGEAITRGLSSSLGLDFQVAEEYKKTYGLTSQVEGKVALEIEPILSTTVNEFKKAISYFDNTSEEHLSLLVLTGGSSLLPGLSEHFAKALGIEVHIADPFSFMTFNDAIQPELKKNSPLFTVAVGLALKE